MLALLTASSAEAHEGWGILLDARGRVYFTDIPTNTIWRISETGRVERIARKHSHALHMDAAGNVYGSNPHLTLPIKSIWQLTPQGTVSDVLAPTRDFALGLQSFAMDSRGAVYSMNSRNATIPLHALMRRNPDGSIDRIAGSERGHRDGTGAEAQFTGIDGMTWESDSALLVADGPYIRRVTTDGVVTTLIAKPLTGNSFGEDLMGITVARSGTLLVADFAAGRVLRIGADASLSETHATRYPWAPTGVVEKDGAVYVLEHLRLPFGILGDLRIGPYLRIERIAADGTVTTLETLWGTRTWLALVVLLSIVSVAAGIRYLYRLRRR